MYVTMIISFSSFISYITLTHLLHCFKVYYFKHELINHQNKMLVSHLWKGFRHGFDTRIYALAPLFDSVPQRRRSDHDVDESFLVQQVDRLHITVDKTLNQLYCF
jgi:hypothetical protein